MKTLLVRHLWLVDHHPQNFLLQLLVEKFDSRSFLKIIFFLNLGIFVAKGDVGVGTIVGSAVFNIACVIGICGLCVNGVSLNDE